MNAADVVAVCRWIYMKQVGSFRMDASAVMANHSVIKGPGWV